MGCGPPRGGESAPGGHSSIDTVFILLRRKPGTRHPGFGTILNGCRLPGTVLADGGGQERAKSLVLAEWSHRTTAPSSPAHKDRNGRGTGPGSRSVHSGGVLPCVVSFSVWQSPWQ